MGEYSNKVVCSACDNTGIYKKPKDEKKYDAEFDRLDFMGSFAHDDCREKALKYAGFIRIPCPYCKKGKHLSALIEYRDSTQETIEVFKNLEETLGSLGDIAKVGEIKKMTAELKIILSEVTLQLKKDFKWV
ncbi:hypothetical protein AALB39_27455 [Lachnospiraceae bacterium 54-53]